MVAHFDIAAIFEIFAIAAGFVLLHRAKKEEAQLLKIAGIILIAGGILVGLCTTYYSFTYYHSGYFDHPGMMGPGRGYMNRANMPMGPGGSMEPGNMPTGPGGGMMQGR